MYLKQTFSLLAIVLLASVTNALALCPGVYFKNTGTQQLSMPLTKATYVDMDGDGIKDLIGYNQRAAYVVVFYKGSVNGFDTPPVITSFPFQGSAAIGENAFGDFNNDGKLDMIFQQNSLTTKLIVYLNNGSGGFTPSAETPIIALENILRLVDFNGDGRLDILSTSTGYSTNAIVRLADADNHFSPGTLIASNAANILVSDFNNDGRNDIFYTSNNTFPAKMFITLNQGNGTFADADSHAMVDIWHYSNRASLADVNNDGRMDVIFPATSVTNDPPFQFYFPVFRFVKGHIVQTDVDITAALDRTVAQHGYYQNSPRTGDFDGDGVNDLMFFSPYVGSMLVKHTGGMNFTSQVFGPAGDPAPVVTAFAGDAKADLLSVNKAQIDLGYSLSVTFKQNVCERQGQTKFVDFDGNGESDIGFWRPSDGRWMFYDQGAYTGLNGNVNWGSGALGDIPVPQDYDGDGFSDFAVYRATTGYWYIYRSSDGQVMISQLGSPGDKPVPADYDGDGSADLGVFRPTKGTWYYTPSSAPGKLVGNRWGLSGDNPLPMDYDGDGLADIAVYRPSTQVWYVLNSRDGSFYIKNFGGPDDYPVPGDYDNDNRTDIAIFRPTGIGFGFNWSILTSRNLYADAVGNSAARPFATFGSSNGTEGFSSQPAAYNPISFEFLVHNHSPFIFSGNSGNKNISWILPLD